MAKKFFFQEKDFEATVPTFSIDLVQALEDQIKLYSSKGRSEDNRKIIFAYQDALRIIRKLEGIYLDKQEQNK
jgi:hypothetical protein